MCPGRIGRGEQVGYSVPHDDVLFIFRGWHGTNWGGVLLVVNAEALLEQNQARPRIMRLTVGRTKQGNPRYFTIPVASSVHGLNGLENIY